LTQGTLIDKYLANDLPMCTAFHSKDLHL